MHKDSLKPPRKNIGVDMSRGFPAPWRPWCTWGRCRSNPIWCKNFRLSKF